ncbi:hypothetical protein BJ508DRAFT_307777 [Ascobolus immersus RN42]|uniref:F-box domain-containing protein n=1 Tax=Ascobolus immersus RN42 TaxID=1160509 RepID=A0A3N4I1U2_ASCIM|nr:hypothetical protein BJ508DRAFT_307777 [Ascobolus immersus RN42]
MQHLPLNVQLHIIENLDSSEEIRAMQLTSKTFYSLLERYSTSIYRTMIGRKWGPELHNRHLTVLRILGDTRFAEREEIREILQLPEYRWKYPHCKNRRLKMGPVLSPTIAASLGLTELRCLESIEERFIQPYLQVVITNRRENPESEHDPAQARYPEPEWVDPGQSRTRLVSGREIARVRKGLYSFLSLYKHWHRFRCICFDPEDGIEDYCRDETGSVIVNDLDAPYTFGYSTKSLFDAKALWEELSVEDHMQVVSVLTILSELENLGYGTLSYLCPVQQCRMTIKPLILKTSMEGDLESMLYHRILNQVERNGELPYHTEIRRAIFSLLLDRSSLWDSCQHEPKNGEYILGSGDYMMLVKSECILTLSDGVDSSVEAIRKKHLFVPNAAYYGGREEDVCNWIWNFKDLSDPAFSYAQGHKL